jgi:hypothetical protein
VRSDQTTARSRVHPALRLPFAHQRDLRISLPYQPVDSPHAINSSYQSKWPCQDEASNQIFCVGRVDRRRRSCELRDTLVGWRKDDLGSHVLTFFNETSQLEESETSALECEY